MVPVMPVYICGQCARFLESIVDYCRRELDTHPVRGDAVDSMSFDLSEHTHSDNDIHFEHTVSLADDEHEQAVSCNDDHEERLAAVEDAERPIPMQQAEHAISEASEDEHAVTSGAFNLEQPVPAIARKTEPDSLSAKRAHAQKTTMTSARQITSNKCPYCPKTYCWKQKVR